MVVREGPGKIKTYMAKFVTEPETPEPITREAKDAATEPTDAAATPAEWPAEPTVRDTSTAARSFTPTA